MNDKEFMDKIHILIHSVRLIPNYKPSEFEKKVSLAVIEKFSSSCSECKSVGENAKNVKPKKSILNKIGEVLDE